MTPSTATPDDVVRLLGEVDPFVVTRILATGATVDEIDEAMREIEDERGFGNEIHVPSSPRVAEVRSVLDELVIEDTTPEEA